MKNRLKNVDWLAVVTSASSHPSTPQELMTDFALGQDFFLIHPQKADQRRAALLAAENGIALRVFTRFEESESQDL